MSKYKFDVSLVISGLSEGVFELQPSDYLYCEDEDEYLMKLTIHCVVHFASISSSLEYTLANQTGVTQKDFWKNGGD